VFGIAYDATEREVHVLFSGCPGYQRCLLVPSKTGSQKPYAFVQFDTPSNAALAMESRNGSDWGEGAGQSIAIEPAKRDIPSHFESRYANWKTGGSGSGGFPQPLAAHQNAAAPQFHHRPWDAMGQGASAFPPAKRPRTESLLEKPFHVALPQPQLEAEDDGEPKTLHLGGLPVGLVQVDLDVFIAQNFPNSVVGSTVVDPGRSGKPGQNPTAFIGFVSHAAAEYAHQQLNGFVWEGSTVRAEWARKEYKPLNGGGGGGSQQDYVATAVNNIVSAAYPLPLSLPAPVAAAAMQKTFPSESQQFLPPQPLDASSFAMPVPERPRHDYTRFGSATRTIHFTSLPFVEEAELRENLQTLYGEQVLASKFKLTQDGRPPVAWVLFADEQMANMIAKGETVDWLGHQVNAAMARTELEIRQR